ncbi:hypothetical protein EVAR_41688_1 [Eumeta japonica]|uniref:DUF5641 domain-containing protein n=1 Tax=Eumeta variegata TaxID=151549 RepID=A0A4C1VND2_EUMVA|nr:hypothetical protein EVAR_41688_1 [Eumeta japonica]
MQNIWKRFQSEYLHNLQQRYKRTNLVEFPQVEDLVLIKQDYVPLLRRHREQILKLSLDGMMLRGRHHSFLRTGGYEKYFTHTRTRERRKARATAGSTGFSGKITISGSEKQQRNWSTTRPRLARARIPGRDGIRRKDESPH